MTTDPLAPLVATLLDRANQEAADILADADTDAQASLDGARAEARRLLAEARASGTADAAEVLAAERTRAERGARAVRLAAQEKAYEHARQAARAAVGRLRHDAAYADLLTALRARATEELGPAATMTELPSGGIEASHDNRRLEFALDGLADDLLNNLGEDVQELWSP